MNYVNTDKLNRAKKYAEEKGKKDDEATIKARYLELGGLITGEEEVEAESEEKTTKAKKTKKSEDFEADVE